MTLAEIARLAGVSRTTASYVVNGQAQARRISPQTVERVMAVVQRHHYRIDAQAAALRRGIDISHLRARQLKASDFLEFDYVLGMDSDNLAAMQALKPADSQAKVGLLLEYAGLANTDVPDPYYGGEAGFEQVLDMIEQASTGLIAELTCGR